MGRSWLGWVLAGSQVLSASPVALARFALPLPEPARIEIAANDSLGVYPLVLDPIFPGLPDTART